MPLSLDHVLNKIIGPMIKKVVASRSEAAREVSDQWEWSRLDGELTGPTHTLEADD